MYKEQYKKKLYWFFSTCTSFESYFGLITAPYFSPVISLENNNNGLKMFFSCFQLQDFIEALKTIFRDYIDVIFNVYFLCYFSFSWIVEGLRMYITEFLFPCFMVDNDLP